MLALAQCGAVARSGWPEVETQMERTGVWTPGGESGRRGWGVMDWEIGIDVYTLICVQWVTSGSLLYV